MKKNLLVLLIMSFSLFTKMYGQTNVEVTPSASPVYSWIAPGANASEPAGPAVEKITTPESVVVVNPPNCKAPYKACGNNCYNPNTQICCCCYNKGCNIFTKVTRGSEYSECYNYHICPPAH